MDVTGNGTLIYLKSVYCHWTLGGVVVGGEIHNQIGVHNDTDLRTETEGL
jgi:hypothetical protein